MNINYSTNWMGVFDIDWYRKRGLVKIVRKVQKEDSKITGRKIGEEYDWEEITERWSGGRIDVYGTDYKFGYELALPIMHDEDYSRFTYWLYSIKSVTILSLDDLVEMYEQTNPKIRWAEDTFSFIESSINI